MITVAKNHYFCCPKTIPTAMNSHGFLSDEHNIKDQLIISNACKITKLLVCKYPTIKSCFDHVMPSTQNKAQRCSKLALYFGEILHVMTTVQMLNFS